jgi:hypothetical protein
VHDKEKKLAQNTEKHPELVVKMCYEKREDIAKIRVLQVVGDVDVMRVTMHSVENVQFRYC